MNDLQQKQGTWNAGKNPFSLSPTVRRNSHTAGICLRVPGVPPPALKGGRLLGPRQSWRLPSRRIRL